MEKQRWQGEGRLIKRKEWVKILGHPARITMNSELSLTIITRGGGSRSKWDIVHSCSKSTQDLTCPRVHHVKYCESKYRCKFWNIYSIIHSTFYIIHFHKFRSKVP
jgi:hypothetical protein